MPTISDQALDQLFRNARTQNGWLDKPVSEAELRAIYDLTKMGPTSVNIQPQRIVFLTTPASKERLKPHLSEGNRDKTMSAPVTAILAYDTDFFVHIPKVFPHNPGARAWFEGKPHAESTAFRNATLQGAYFILAARAVGLDTGPMSGFDNAGVDKEFFAGTTFKSNFIVALGHGDHSKVFARSPRFDFTEVCQVL